MSSTYSKLFDPIEINGLKIKNRTSMAPMGLVARSDGGGGFNKATQEYYIERARGGVGLIITGIVPADYEEILEFGLPCPTYNPMLFSASTYEMNEKIHAYGSKIFLQITGGLGRSGIPGFLKKHIAPSKHQNRFDPRIEHREMTKEEIQTLVGNFVKSAVVAKQSGFDGVEIHAVHEGYLLDQFAISFFNQRTDEYGGDLAGRLKISTDIVKGIKKACGENFPVSLRYSIKSFMKGLRQGALPGEEFTEAGKDYEEGIEAAKLLVEAGYDALNVDAGTYDSWYWNHPPMYFEDGMYREFGKMLKGKVDVPIIVAGRMENPDLAVAALEDCCDMVGYGRPLLADPQLVNKIQRGDYADVRPCLSCHDGCMGRIPAGQAISCAVNPACGRELEYSLTKTEETKKVLVVGGGLAGMEAARVCKLRGHDVEIIERSDKLGGNINPGAVPEFKRHDRALVRWYEKQLADLNIPVRFGNPVDGGELEKSDADVIITATGAKPIKLPFGDATETAVDILNEKAPCGENVVIIGGGLVGCETGLWLAGKGKNVQVVEMAPDVLGGPHGMPLMNYSMLKDLLAYNKVELHVNSRVENVNDGVVTVQNGEKKFELKADTVINAVGYRSEDSLYERVKMLPKEVYNLGDSRNVKNIMYAIWDAYEVAGNI